MRTGRCLEEVLNLDPEGEGDLLERPDRGLALAVLDGVDGLRADRGLFGKSPRGHALGLSELLQLFSVHGRNNTPFALTFQGKDAIM
jgi:hypothetical protein